MRYDLDAAISVAAVVDNAEGSIAPELLAAALGYSGTNNGTYLTRVANARLFGVVGGRGSRVDLTDRGRRILRGEPSVAAEARREAFLAVPLFRAVFESLPIGPLESRTDLATRLVDEFGEPADKAVVVAGKFLDSGLQAQVLDVGKDGKFQAKGRSGKFTLVDNRRPDTLLASVVKSRPGRRRGRMALFRPARGDDMDENQMWLDEESPVGTTGVNRLSNVRRAGVVAAAVACLAVVAVPLSVALSGTSHSPPTAQAPKHHHNGGRATTLGNGPAEHQVLGALSATTDSGNFDFTYHLSSTPPTSTAPTTTTTTTCHTVTEGVVSAEATVPPGLVMGQPVPGGTQTVTVCSGPSVTSQGTPVNGKGVSNTNPKATLIDFTLGTGNSGLAGSLRVDSTTLYEDLSNTETSLAPPPSQANVSGQAISSFASLTESTIGLREGAVAMIGMASPTGYLDLYQQDIDGAAQTGTSTVDGMPVTVYKVAVDPTQLINDPGITSEESQTATAAISVLKAQGYTGTTDEVSVDNSGFIREVDSVANFSDGGTVVLNVNLTNFGCAGTVLMPGQSGPSDPPSGCTSPDTGVAPTTTTTTTDSAATAPSGTTPMAPATTSTSVAPTTTSSPTTTSMPAGGGTG